VLSEGLENKDYYVAALEKLHGAPGRLQNVAGHPRGAAVYVDYAHTPDALETVLKALRPHTQGRLVCLFGCGGNRDTGKRPIMGQIAVDLSDMVIVTDDNPRTERAEAIRSDVMEGAAGAVEIEGRRTAIQHAVNLLQAGDVLVIAGKGHEQGQIFADHTEPFDDSEEATKAMQSISE
jgi:UDP-N-acetylmuramoyl-L-alanyl-D-glutamate--2,6-diaminopimelate ligase